MCSKNRSNFCNYCNSIYVVDSTYYPQCARCYYHTHPDETPPKRFKTKERYIYEFLNEKYPDMFTYDKRINGGCTLRRPDFIFDILTHCVIVEIDEDQHKYGYSCENKRIMEIFESLGNRPLVVIRLNPDKYEEEKGIVNGCFSFKEKKLITNKEEFDRRMNQLIEKLQYNLNNIPKKEVTIEQLFFDEQ